MPLQANLKSVAQEREADNPGGGWPYMEQHLQTRPAGNDSYGIVRDGADMPFESEAQRRWMFANKPEMAKRWQKETPKGKKLPMHVKKESGLLATMRMEKDAGRVTDALGSAGVGLRKALGGALKGVGHATSGARSFLGGALKGVGRATSGAGSVGAFLLDGPANVLKRMGEAVTPKPKPKQPQPAMAGSGDAGTNGVQANKVVTAANIHSYFQPKRTAVMEPKHARDVAEYLFGEMAKTADIASLIQEHPELAVAIGLPVAGATAGAVGTGLFGDLGPGRRDVAAGLRGKERGKLRRAFEHTVNPMGAAAYRQGQRLRETMSGRESKRVAEGMEGQYGVGSKLVRALQLMMSPLAVPMAPLLAAPNALMRLGHGVGSAHGAKRDDQSELERRMRGAGTGALAGAASGALSLVPGGGVANALLGALGPSSVHGSRLREMLGRDLAPEELQAMRASGGATKAAVLSKFASVVTGAA